MKNRWSKKSRLSRDLFVWSVLSLIISIILYIVLSTFSTYIIENYYCEESNMEKVENIYLNKLQNYIEDNNISIDDITKIDAWNEENDNIYVKLFLNHNLIFDTAYGAIDYKNIDTEKIESFSHIKYRNLKIQGSDVQALFFYGDFPSEVYANYCSIILSCLLFFTLLIRGVKKKILYLVKIKNELDTLSHTLETSITIRGRDEITEVAHGIELLRLSIIDKLKKEKLAHDANMKLVTSLSHDIKTPLTSIITYLELSSERVHNDEKLEKYLGVSLKKANHLKDLSNELFEHFLLHSDQRNIAFETVNANELIVQMLEENLFDLEMNGVYVCRTISDIRSQLCININLVNRLFNNIFSNIYKYADLNKGINVKYYIENDCLVVSLENYKTKEFNQKLLSSGVGLNNCKAIMEKHCGKFEVMETADIYSTSLYFLIATTKNTAELPLQE